jgi:lipopolysaccharide/colanic/teichoic acid biosynthesis glycosyltransferase
MYNVIQRFAALFFLILLLPVFVAIAIALLIFSGYPVLFTQWRSGINKNPFLLYKFRTMQNNAEEKKKKYKHLNEAEGPVFKIRNDPRYTKVGRLLSHSGLDELPQIFNVVKGDMAFVGPRPLPTHEATQVPEKYQKRFSVLPGITSPWIIMGAHHLGFDQWMKLDVEYVQNKSVLNDATIIFKTIALLSLNMTKLFKNKPEKYNRYTNIKNKKNALKQRVRRKKK